MKYLLTSAGIKNASIHNALIDLLGKPIAESNALCIPTGGYGNPHGSPGGPWRFIIGGTTALANGQRTHPLALRPNKRV